MSEQPNDIDFMDAHIRSLSEERVDLLSQIASANAQHDVTIEQLAAAEDELKRLRSFRGCDGCSTGDCPHDSVHDCVAAQGAIIQADSAEIERLKGHLLSHGSHAPSCNARFYGADQSCNCGWNDLAHKLWAVRKSLEPTP